jgi:ligand-binding SRPBCC domain-containing protein
VNFIFSQYVGASHERVAAFFGDAANLLKITPAFPRMTIEAASTIVRPGARFTLVMHVGLSAVRWDITVEEVVPGREFVDTGRAMFLRSWRHTHRFEPEGDGCRVTDLITCRPAWWAAPFLWAGTHLLFHHRRRSLPRLLA